MNRRQYDSLTSFTARISNALKTAQDRVHDAHDDVFYSESRSQTLRATNKMRKHLQEMRAACSKYESLLNRKIAEISLMED